MQALQQTNTLAAAFMPFMAETVTAKKKITRRTLRTTMTGNKGVPVGAKIDLTTGEIISHEYKDYNAANRKARQKANPVEMEPPWVRILPPKRCRFDPSLPDLSRIKTANGVKMYIEQYFDPEEALSDLPILDDLINGAVRLHMEGSTRPLRPGRIFTLLQVLEVISSQTVQQATGYSTSHSKRYAHCLRIIVTAFEAEANKVIHR